MEDRVDWSLMGFSNDKSPDRHSLEAIHDWAHTGMTLILSPEFDPTRHRPADLRAMLDTAVTENIKMIIRDGRTRWQSLAEGEEAYRRAFTEAVRDFGYHPAVFGFHAGDRPMADDFATACRACHLQREVAPHLSPFLNLPSGIDDVSRAKYLEEYVQEVKPGLLGYDCTGLSGSDEDRERFFSGLREFHEVSMRHDLPFWIMLPMEQHHATREDTLRWRVNTASAHGAKGVLWSALSFAVPERDRLGQINRACLQWQAPVLLGLTLQRVRHIGQAWGGAPLFAGTRLVRTARALHAVPLILSEFTDARGRDYVAVVNNSPVESTVAEICVCGYAPRLQRVGGQRTRREVTVTSPWLATTRADHTIARCSLAPGQMELYRVEMTGIRMLGSRFAQWQRRDRHE